MTKAQKHKILVEEAVKNLGRPYFYGARPEEAPRRFDCSSFVQYLYKKVGIDLPRNSIDQAASGRCVRDAKKLKVGDLLFFTSKVGRYNRKFPMGVGHVAIYIGSNRGIHAKYKKLPGGVDGGKVKLDSLDYFLRRRGDFVIAKRFI